MKPPGTVRLCVAIDFDGTFAADPLCFSGVVALMRNCGHVVVMVTQRGEAYRPMVELVTRGQLPVVFADGKSKRFAARCAGYDVDVWIDDNPDSVDTARVYVGG